MTIKFEFPCKKTKQSIFGFCQTIFDFYLFTIYNVFPRFIKFIAVNKPTLVGRRADAVRHLLRRRNDVGRFLRERHRFRRLLRLRKSFDVNHRDGHGLRDVVGRRFVRVNSSLWRHFVRGWSCVFDQLRKSSSAGGL